MNKKLAFTLAEVLITLSIIGIVAALTVPNIINNYQKETQAIQIRKAVNDLAGAFDILMTEEGKTKLTSTSVYTGKKYDGTVYGITPFIKEKFKVVREYSCFASKYKSISGTSANFSCDGEQYLLSNSNAICIKKGTKKFNITIDTNGPDKPNTSGRDLFALYIDENGEIKGDGASSGSSGSGYGSSGDACDTSTNGKYCLNKLMENNWKMDY